jgi:hypothetical protein
MEYKQITSDELFDMHGEAVGIKFKFAQDPNEMRWAKISVSKDTAALKSMDDSSAVEVIKGSNCSTMQFFAVEKTSAIVRTPIKISGTPMKGWELLKIIDNGMINEHDMIYDQDSNPYSYIDNAVKGHRTNFDIAPSRYLTDMFTIKKAMFYTFNEAITQASGSRIRHKSMQKFSSIPQALTLIAFNDEAAVKRMLEAEEWEIESK